MLGVGFISQVKHCGISRELEGIQGQQMECYVKGQKVRSWSLHARWGRLGLVPAGYVVKYVWGACKVTLYAGDLLPLLLGASWRFWRANENYHFRQRIWSEAIYFRAEISCYEVFIDFKSTYRQDLIGVRCELSQNFRNQFASGKRFWDRLS